MNKRLEELRRALIRAGEEELESNTTNTTNTTNRTNTTGRTNRSFLDSAETISASPRFMAEEEREKEKVVSAKSKMVMVLGDVNSKILSETKTLKECQNLIESQNKWITQDDVSYCKMSIFVDKSKDRFYMNVSSKLKNDFVRYRATLTNSKYDFIGNIKKWYDYKNFPQYQNLYDIYEISKEKRFVFMAGKMRPPKKRVNRQQKMAPLAPLCTAYMMFDDENDCYIVGVYIHDFHIELQYEKYLANYVDDSHPYFTVEYRPGVDNWEV